jgi:hypothetical protein
MQLRAATASHLCLVQWVHRGCTAMRAMRTGLVGLLAELGVRLPDGETRSNERGACTVQGRLRKKPDNSNADWRGLGRRTEGCQSGHQNSGEGSGGDKGGAEGGVARDQRAVLRAGVGAAHGQRGAGRGGQDHGAGDGRARGHIPVHRAPPHAESRPGACEATARAVGARPSPFARPENPECLHLAIRTSAPAVCIWAFRWSPTFSFSPRVTPLC